MSEAEDVIRSGFEAFNARDWSAVHAVCHPDVEWRPPRDLPGSGLYRGPEGVEEAMRDMLAVFANLHAEEHKIIDLEDGRVVALFRWRGSTASGLTVDPFEVRSGGLLELDGGLIRKGEFFTEWETPQRLAGLDPEAGTAES